MRQELEHAMMQRVIAQVQLQARIRNIVRRYNYVNLINIMYPGHVWALEAARRLAHRLGVPLNVDIRIRYHLRRSCTGPEIQEL